MDVNLHHLKNFLLSEFLIVFQNYILFIFCSKCFNKMQEKNLNK